MQWVYVLTGWAPLQVVDAAKALADEKNPEVWGLKLIVLCCIAATAWMGRKLASRPREKEVDDLKLANERLREAVKKTREETKKLREQKDQKIDELKEAHHESELQVAALKAKLSNGKGRT